MTRSNPTYSWWTIAHCLWAATVVGTLLLNVFWPPYEGYWVWALSLVAYPVAAALILAQRPGNRVGRVLAVVAISAAVIFVGGWVASTWRAESWTAYVESIIAAAPPILFWGAITLLYVFPTGRARGRFRWVLFGFSAVIGVMVVLAPFAPSIRSLTGRPNPLAGPEWVGVMYDSGIVVLVPGLVGGIWSAISRFRSASSEVRAQLRWFMTGIVAVAGLVVVVGFIPEDLPSPYEQLSGVVVVLGFWALPASIVIAVMKYRLYDIDVVVSRTISYTLLAGFITSVYALIVVGIGTVLGRESNLVLSLVAVAVVAMAFEPLRVRVQGWANRLVFGERATPYEVLAQATRRLADTTSPEDSLARIVDLVVSGTGASEAVLWMRIGDRLRPRSANTPEVLEAHIDVSIPSDTDPVVPGDTAVLVRHRGELLGAVSITKPRGQAVTRADEKVLADVAAGAGLLLRNIGLNTQLAERAEQLRASRRRLVEAHDAERHRLERDLHDGAQQQVVALKVKLGIARTLATREGAGQIAGIVESLAADTQIAVDEMRAVAHGIYPPLLESDGLAPALAALAGSVAVPVGVDAGRLGRYDRSLEETVYFCVLEAVVRAADQGAHRISVNLSDTRSTVDFTVRCDVPIGDLNMVVDRIDAVGGTVTVEDRGTVLTAQLPIEGRSDPRGVIFEAVGVTRS